MRASEHFKQYASLLIDGLVSVDTQQLDKACEAIVNAISNGKNIFICGNGGSAAVAEHFCCDHSKGIHIDTGMLPQIQSLTSSIPTLTAIANDIGYEKVFTLQLAMKATEGDLLIVVSSSGNSPNIIDVANLAKSKKITVIALVGFDGGAVKNTADIVLHVKSNNYGVVEDTHQSLTHIMAQSIRLTYLNKDTIKL